MSTKIEYKFLDILEEFACKRRETTVEYLFLEYENA